MTIQKALTDMTSFKPCDEVIIICPTVPELVQCGRLSIVYIHNDKAIYICELFHFIDMCNDQKFNKSFWDKRQSTYNVPLPLLGDIFDTI